MKARAHASLHQLSAICPLPPDTQAAAKADQATFLAAQEAGEEWFNQRQEKQQPSEAFPAEQDDEPMKPAHAQRPPHPAAASASASDAASASASSKPRRPSSRDTSAATTAAQFAALKKRLGKIEAENKELHAKTDEQDKEIHNLEDAYRQPVPPRTISHITSLTLIDRRAPVIIRAITNATRPRERAAAPRNFVQVGRSRTIARAQPQRQQKPQPLGK